MRWSRLLLTVSLLGASAFLLFETLRLAALAGEFEVRAVLAERALDAARAERDALAAAAVADVAPSAPDAPPDRGEEAAALALEDYSRLQLELFTTREQLAALRALLAERNAELERRAEASKRRVEESLRPMPLGVRECLSALHECLRAEGFTSQRFLRATSIDADGLHDVELIEAAADGLGATFLTAARMTASLDRSTGRLELRFFEGRRSVDGKFYLFQFYYCTWICFL